MIVRALFVEDEAMLAAQYAENITVAVRDTCAIELDFAIVPTVEEAKRRLPPGQTEFQLVVTDMLFPPVGNPAGVLKDRGREVIQQALKTEGVVVVAISQGDTQNYPTLHEDAVALGAIFRYKQQITGQSRGQNLSGWDDLARAICAALKSGSTCTVTEPNAGRKVFVVHGRNVPLVQSLFDFLRAVGLEPLEWDALIGLTQRRPGGNANPDLMTIIRAGFAEAHGAVVLFSPDDDAQLQKKHWSPEEEEIEKRLAGQPRPNVLLEAGYALGYRFDRTLIVSVGKIRPISDLAGRHILRLSDSAASRKAFTQRLADMGFRVQTDGDRWLTVGKFDA
jgi:predicted nucleotide-binding protein